MKKIIMIVTVLLLIAAAVLYFRGGRKELTSVGFLFPDSMYDQTWGTEGYKGMLDIVQTYDTAFFYEQNINTRPKIERSISEMSARNVNILFGQGKEYTEVFNDVAARYPDIQFVVFNGKSTAENVTAINIDGYSVGFFSGMIAGHHTDNNHIGVIGAFKSQPDIKGFIDGAKFENPDVMITEKYIHTFGYDHKGATLAEQMIKRDHVDVIFPAADGINADVMSLAKEQDISTIGYIIDQSMNGPQVLTSLQLNLSKAYAQAADQYSNNQLRGGTYYLGVKEDMVELGPISYRIDEEFQKRIKQDFDRYEKKLVLPNGIKETRSHFESYLKTSN